MCRSLEDAFLSDAVPADTKTWQGLDISNRPEMTPLELMYVTLEVPMMEPRGVLQDVVKPNLPWADAHFDERVSGIPHNPPPSHLFWPHATRNNEAFVDEQAKFSHTYPERFWPKEARVTWGETAGGLTQPFPMRGIRYEYGDLGDVVDLLDRDPYTRQGYLPVFFPEDTGAHHGERVPCTLGYQFFIREGKLDVIYYIRSCDFMRHFRDDVYLAIRLGQWVMEQLKHRNEKLQWLHSGRLIMHIGSFHVFAGDIPILKMRKGQRET